MNPISVGALASATKSNQPGDGAGRTFFKALLLVSTLLSGGLAARPANAWLSITTTGTITPGTGSETGGLFGSPDTTTSLTGSYILTVYYANLGPGYFTDGSGTFASDFDNIAGSVTATVNGVSVTTPLTTSLGASLFEDLFGLDASNQGYDGSSVTGAYVNVLQDLTCNSGPCVPYADLMTPFSYVLGAFDSGTDQYTFQGAGYPAPGTPAAMFAGTETSLSLTVPEPASWVMLATGLLGLGVLVRRRGA